MRSVLTENGHAVPPKSDHMESFDKTSAAVIEIINVIKEAHDSYRATQQ